MRILLPGLIADRVFPLVYNVTLNSW